MVVARTPSWNRHKGKNEYMTAAILAMFNSDKGYMKVTLPEVDPCEEENPYFSIGIIQGYTEEDTKAGEPSGFAYVSDPEDMPQTKAASYNFRYTWAMDTFSHAAFLVYSQKYSYINNFLSTNIPAAHKVLEDLKFRLPSNTIIYKIEEFPKDDNAWGFMQSSKFITSWGYIRLNAKMLYEFANSAGTDSFTTMQGQIQQTLVHETSHAVHEFSYERCLYVLLKSQAIRCTTEDRQANGQADIVADSPAGVFIFELKVNESADEALRQVREKHYDAPYHGRGLPIWTIGLNFDSNTRQLVEAKVERS